MKKPRQTYWVHTENPDGHDSGVLGPFNSKDQAENAKSDALKQVGVARAYWVVTASFTEEDQV